MESSELRSGFVAVIGRTNVGKSSLVNTMVGEKLSIISEKPQTTRNRIHCILTNSRGQAVFLDTPGIHSPRTKLGERMNAYAMDTLREVDLILFVTNADTAEPGKGDLRLVKQLSALATKILLVINKGDLVSEDEGLQLISKFAALGNWACSFVVSALTGMGIESLLESIFNTLPEGSYFYPEDMIIDQPERFLAAEIIREKVLQLTREEIPHGVAVDIESMKEMAHERDGDEVIDICHIASTIYVERESPKGIIIGAKGSMLKEIGIRARQDLEKLLGLQVHLELRVKVRSDWRNSEHSLREFGYRR